MCRDGRKEGWKGSINVMCNGILYVFLSLPYPRARTVYPFYFAFLVVNGDGDADEESQIYNICHVVVFKLFSLLLFFSSILFLFLFSFSLSLFFFQRLPTLSFHHFLFVPLRAMTLSRGITRNYSSRV